MDRTRRLVLFLLLVTDVPVCFEAVSGLVINLVKATKESDRRLSQIEMFASSHWLIEIMGPLEPYGPLSLGICFQILHLPLQLVAPIYHEHWSIFCEEASSMHDRHGDMGPASSTFQTALCCTFLVKLRENTSFAIEK